MDIVELGKVLQASIAPCVLISGLGLLLLSMTNRLARPIDRIRLLCKERPSVDARHQSNIDSQIDVLYKRCSYLRSAIGLNIASISGVSLVVLLLFWGQTSGMVVVKAVEVAFSFSVFGMIASLVLFALDIRLALRSLHLELNKPE